MRKAWRRPKLVILMRGKPQEAILGVCKVGGSSVSPSAFRDGCDFEPSACEVRSMTGIGHPGVICGPCSETVGS